MGRLMATLDDQLDNARKQAELSKLKLQKIKDDAYALHLNKAVQGGRKRPRGWTTPGRAKRDMCERDRQSVMAQARQKVEESPIVSGMVSTMAANVVGEGFKLSMITGDSKYDKEVEARWNMAKDKLDIRGMRTWGQLQRMWYSRRFIDGDVGIIKVDGGKFGGGVRTYLQTIESDRIAKQSDPAHTGIIYDKVGRPKVFLVTNRIEAANQKALDEAAKKRRSKRYPADDFIFFPYFPQERAERERGVSRFLQAINAIADLEQILDAMLQKVKNESFMGIKFFADISEGGSLFGSALEESKEAEDGKSRKHVSMVPGMNLNLSEGENAEVMESKSPNSEWSPYINFMLRLIGTGIGLPLEVLLLDWSNVSYSGGRSILELAKKRWRIDQADMKRPSTDAFEFWLAREIAYNGLKPPKALTEQKKAWAHRWVTPGWPYIDPVKEVNAQGQAIALGLASRQQILDETGDGTDFADLVDQLAREASLAEEAGVSLMIGQPGQVSTSGDEAEPEDSEDEPDEQEEDSEE